MGIGWTCRWKQATIHGVRDEGDPENSYSSIELMIQDHKKEKMVTKLANLEDTLLIKALNKVQVLTIEN